MRTLIFILVILGIVLYLYIKFAPPTDKIKFKFRFVGAQFNLQNLIQLLTKGITQTRVMLGAKIINENAFPLFFSDFKATLSYNNTLVAQTVENSPNLSKVVVPANGEYEVVDNVTVYVTNEAIQLLREIADNKKPVVKYWIQVKIFGISKTFEGTEAISR